MTGAHAITRDGSHVSREPVERTLGRVLRALIVALRARRGVAFVVEPTGRAYVAATRGLDGRNRRYLQASLRHAVGAHGRASDAARRPPTRRSREAMAAAAPYWERLSSASQPVFFTAAESAALLPAAWARRLRVTSHFAMPLLASDGGLVGIFVVETTRPVPAQVRVAAAIADVAATAIVNDRTARAQAEEARRSEVLLEIVRDVARALPLAELLPLICRRTVESFGVQRVTIFDWHPRAGGYVPLADHGTPMHVAERFVHSRYYSATSTPHRDEVTAGNTVVLSRARDLTPEDRMLLDIADLHTLALLPLRADNRTSGMLTAGIATPEDFTPEQIRGLEVVAHHAATAIAQARSLHAIDKAARFRAAVSALAVDLNAETSRAGALALLCARARAMFRASTGVLLLAAGEHLISVAVDDEAGGAGEALAVPLAAADTAVVRAFSTGEAVLANDIGKPGRDSARATDEPGGFRSLLAIPLVGGDTVAGVLLVADTARRRHFDPNVADEARVLGALAATVLRNLDLMTRVHETNAELRHVNRLKDQFLANVSHDLRTPLNVIIGYGQLAREGTFGSPPAELDDVLARMIASARQQLALVEDLLDFSRIELNTLNVRPCDVPLAPLFAEMEFVLASMVRQKPVRAIVHPVAAGLAVHADRERLRQILTNLLGNAAKFTAAGAIELHAQPDGAAVRIGVRDTGPGIAAEHLETIFEPFRQMDTALSGLGAGLGLAISRQLSTLMGGALAVESTPGLGSTFWITLPAAGPADTRVASAPESGVPAPGC